MKKLFSMLSLAGMMTCGQAEPAQTLVNVDRHGLALQGYDPVSFFHGAPEKGQASFSAAYQGGTYEFASRQDQALFTSHPADYAPQFGGYCAYAVSCGDTAPIEIAAYQILDGKLILQYSKGIRDTFNRDPKGNLQKAEANWPKIVAEKGH